MGNERAAVSAGATGELERERQAFASLVAIMPVAVVATDLETNVTAWNPVAESLFGYSSDEAVGRRIDDLIANRADLRAEVEAFRAAATDMGRYQGITRRMRKDGSLVDVEVLAASIEIDGHASGYYAIYHDVSALYRQKLFYESLLELSPTAIVAVDRDDRVTSWNAAAEQLFEYSREEAIGRNIDDLVANSDEVRDEAREVSRRAPEGPVHLITRRTRKDGSLVDVDLRATPLFVGGELIGLFALFHDISELQRQKQYYSSLLELSPVAVLAIDLQANITSWNAAAEHLFGYSPEEAIGRNIDEVVAPDDQHREEAVALTDRGLSGQAVNLVTQRKRRDGALVDVEVRAAPIMVGGEQVGFYVIYHDITELQRQRRYYEALVQFSPNAIALLDPQGTVTSWNPAAERLFGYSLTEAVGRNIDDLVANDVFIREDALAMSRAGIGHEQVHAITRRTRKDGSLVDVELFGAPVIVGDEAVGLYGLYHDISELQRQRRYYEALFELSPTAIATTDPEVKVTSWNPAAERLFGYSREEAIGQDLNDLVASSDELRAEGVELDRETARGELHRITRRIRKDGSLVDVDLRAAPMVVAGETVGMFCLYHDITDLQRARRDAEAATEAKSAFLATMSHEIRTPMNAVIGMIDLLMRTRLDEEQRSFADVIRTSGEALLSVINDILDFSKIEAGRLDLESHPFDLRECVESALELVARAAAEKGLDLAYELRPGTPEALVGDAPRLRQILLNLLNNAVKFTPEGEVVVTVGGEPMTSPAAPQNAEPAGWYRLHFAVRDTGIGIFDDRIGALFESFSQVDASTTRRYGGTGLGLAISKRLSERMGGSMWVDSAPGSGSTFHFTIEAEAAPAPPRLYDRTGERPLAGRRVLIVDDNATNRHIVRLHAEAWEMLARDTDKPAQALEWIQRGDPFDVAIVDMQMPEMDGVTVARKIREMVDVARLPLILLTSLGRRDAEDENVFDARLAKPIRPSLLYDTLLTVLVGDEAEGLIGEARVATTSSPTRPEIRILVVEDNSLNQQLALLLLENIGYQADTAANGREALEAVERDHYDVVLMDVQMPEMDGLEATRKIHERLGSKRPRIIAATANATQDERERCLAAGMDDYLSKPIRLEELAQALDRQLPVLEPAAAFPAGAAADVPAAVDRAVLDRLRATIGDAGTDALIGTFLEEAPKLLASMSVAAREGDLERLRVSAHTLKSNAATFGAMELAELSRQLERSAQEGSLPEAPELVDRTQRAYERVRPILQQGRGSR
jgi:PAS domain S-box-containing protein